MEDGDDRVVFTGDTLFIGGTSTSSLAAIVLRLMMKQGCGRFFEGTPAEMDTALNETLAALPPDTKVYVGLPIFDVDILSLIGTAGPRVHHAERQVPSEGSAKVRPRKRIGNLRTEQ